MLVLCRQHNGVVWCRDAGAFRYRHYRIHRSGAACGLGEDGWWPDRSPLHAIAAGELHARGAHHLRRRDEGHEADRGAGVAEHRGGLSVAAVVVGEEARGQQVAYGSAGLGQLGKLISDALNGIAWVDDSQVARAMVEKCFGEEASLTVRIGRLL
jgi:hypothetical protein